MDKTKFSGLGALISSKEIGDVNYEDEVWLAYLRDLIGGGELIQHAKIHQVDINLARRYRFNFSGYLRALDYPNELDWINLAINKINHPMDFDGQTPVLFLVDSYTIDGYYRRFIEIEDKRQRR